MNLTPQAKAAVLHMLDGGACYRRPYQNQPVISENTIAELEQAGFDLHEYQHNMSQPWKVVLAHGDLGSLERAFKVALELGIHPGMPRTRGATVVFDVESFELTRSPAHELALESALRDLGADRVTRRGKDYLVEFDAQEGAPIRPRIERIENRLFRICMFLYQDLLLPSKKVSQEEPRSITTDRLLREMRAGHILPPAPAVEEMADSRPAGKPRRSSRPRL